MRKARKPVSDARAMQIAQVMHEAIRAWQAANGQTPAPSWGRAPKWMKEATVASLLWRLENPDAPASAQHDQWMAVKKADGWTSGKTKNGKKKTHPMLVPYAQLPEFEKRKDALVNAIVDALR
ncbi:MAG: hypothetical protein B7Y90_10430 [Alphaproteobacteria bacterium 32-64-14]|nr:MAG: hypothetical protein B7Y90_10430 [Alphaproteobacteria bacterium 32-64-14]